jgi:hypothetical protein
MTCARQDLSFLDIAAALASLNWLVIQRELARNTLLHIFSSSRSGAAPDDPSDLKMQKHIDKLDLQLS